MKSSYLLTGEPWSIVDERNWGGIAVLGLE
jgi:hypothetical protein